MHRPENWENPYSKQWRHPDTPEYSELSMHEAYEAGANAVLEGLKGQGVYMTAGKNGILHITPESTIYTASLITKGTLVFIPDEEAD